MACLPKFMYEEIERKRPHIDEESFKAAVDEIIDGLICEEERDLLISDDGLPYLAIAAAVHELSKMTNEHIAEFYLHTLEKERDRQEE